MERLKLETLNLMCLLISKSRPTYDKLSLKGRGHCHLTSLIFGKYATISENGTR